MCRSGTNASSFVRNDPTKRVNIGRAQHGDAQRRILLAALQVRFLPPHLGRRRDECVWVGLEQRSAGLGKIGAIGGFDRPLAQRRAA